MYREEKMFKSTLVGMNKHGLYGFDFYLWSRCIHSYVHMCVNVLYSYFPFFLFSVCFRFFLCIKSYFHASILMPISLCLVGEAEPKRSAKVETNHNKQVRNKNSKIL